MSKKSPLERAIEIVGSQKELAEQIGTTQQNISDKVRRGARVPAEWCASIERATEGVIKKATLRPDIFSKEAAE